MGFSICAGRGMVSVARRRVEGSKPMVRLEITGGEPFVMLTPEEAMELGKLGLCREAQEAGLPDFGEEGKVFVP